MKTATLIVGSALALKGLSWLLRKAFGGDEPERHDDEPSATQIQPPVSYGASSRPFTYGQPSWGHQQDPIVNQTPPEHSSQYRPHRQPSTLYSTHTPLQPREAVTAKLPNHIQHPVNTLAPEEVAASLVIDQHEDPESLRSQARREGDKMAEYFNNSREAFTRNEKGLAKELSLMGQARKKNMVRLNKEASAKIFQENNKNIRPNTVDLHGLYVQEAEFYFKSEAVQKVWNRAQPLRVIVGKGNHSSHNIPRIKPAIQALVERLGMNYDVDPLNDGCLIVNAAPGLRPWTNLLPEETQSEYYE